MISSFAAKIDQNGITQKSPQFNSSRGYESWLAFITFNYYILTICYVFPIRAIDFGGFSRPYRVLSRESGGVWVAAACPILGKLDGHNFPQAREWGESFESESSWILTNHQLRWWISLGFPHIFPTCSHFFPQFSHGFPMLAPGSSLGSSSCAQVSELRSAVDSHLGPPVGW